MATEKKYLTIAGKRDGFGAQLMARMTGIAYCFHNNIEYVHTPFRTMGHGINQRGVAELEHFCGMYHGDILRRDYPPNSKKVRNKKVIFEVSLSRNPDYYYSSSVRNLLRGKYYSTRKNRTPFFLADHINICLHIRRGDVRGNNIRRHTKNYFYLKIIESLKRSHESAYFHVFSHGDVS